MGLNASSASRIQQSACLPACLPACGKLCLCFLLNERPDSLDLPAGRKILEGTVHVGDTATHVGHAPEAPRRRRDSYRRALPLLAAITTSIDTQRCMCVCTSEQDQPISLQMNPAHTHRVRRGTCTLPHGRRKIRQSLDRNPKQNLDLDISTHETRVVSQRRNVCVLSERERERVRGELPEKASIGTYRHTICPAE